MATEGRLERLQIMLTEEELAAVDDWRFSRRMPSRAASVRELLKRGLSVEGFGIANKSTKSKEFGILHQTQTGAFERSRTDAGQREPPAKK